MDNSGQVFTTINEMVEQTKLPYRRIYNDIKSKKLPAIKKGNRYYIYSKDADKYVFNESVFLRKEESKLDTQKILDNLVFTSNDSIYDVLDRSEQPEEIKKIVEEYLQAAGIFRIKQ